MSDPQAVRRDLIDLVRTALDAAARPDELLDCARAAAALFDPDLSREVTERLAAQIREASEGASAWRLQMQQSKHDTWIQTGHKARVLAEAWAAIAETLPAEMGPGGGGTPTTRNYDRPDPV